MSNMPKIPKIWGLKKRTKIGDLVPVFDVECLLDEVGIDCDQVPGPRIIFLEFLKQIQIFSRF